MPVDNTEPLSVYRAGPGYSACLANMALAASRAHHKRGFLDSILGLPAHGIVRVLSRLALHPGQKWGRVENSYVALVDGVCSGMATVRPAGTRDEFLFSLEAFRDVAATLKMDARWTQAALERRDAFAEAVFPAEPASEGTWRLEWLAVRHENRSAGVARGLLERALADVRAAGAARVEVLCEIGNVRAERLSGTFGFEAVREFPYPAGLPEPGTGFRLLRREPV
ncbi:MAG: GNAT family N-acetyltransferase [Thermodesulfobacteriota bacterium]